ncbi:MAG: hypothetical protein KDK76_07500 [Chlamydiia bacterium]|nr:hypothetical protein [Chlamydiia bacterium]
MRFHLFLLKNWWVIAFVSMAGAIYFQSIHKKNQLVASLQGKVDLLTQAKLDALERKEELLFRIQSQEDPDFIELVLKERLGVTGEGELKVVLQ